MRSQWLSVFSVLAAALCRCLANPLPTPWGEMLVKHKWTHIPDNWVTLSHPPEDTTIDLYIALKPDRENALIDALKQVSQPGHPKYGAHLTKEQVSQLVAPHPDTLELVGSWLRYNGVPPSSISTSHGGGWLTVSGMPVSRANELLGASYQLYYHPGTKETILRTVGYALPAALHIHVQTVAPTTAFTSMHPPQPEETLGSLFGGAVNATSGEPVNMLSRRQPNQPNQPDDPPNIYPSFLRWLYRTDAYSPVTTYNALGIMGHLNEVPYIADLELFMTRFRTDVTETPSMPAIMEVNRRFKSQLSINANLDTQYTMALAYPTTVIYYKGTGNGVQILSNGTAASGDQYLIWLGYMSKQVYLPQTITLGYGTPETHITEQYARALCNLYAQLGALGASVFVASGDAGVGEGECKDRSGNVRFYTTFPASCPYVTSVGGTTWNFDASEEVAYSRSGGGFSAYFNRSEYEYYQDVEVLAFLEKFEFGSEYAGYYNPENRGVPDIALQASRYLVLSTIPGLSHNSMETYYVMSSTGCSTNTAAAIFSLLNDYRISKGGFPFGWLNPWLYTIGWIVFNDITIGNNPGCGTVGFTAKDGWDPVTGLGSPDFQRLQNIIDIELAEPKEEVPDEPNEPVPP